MRQLKSAAAYRLAAFLLFTSALLQGCAVVNAPGFDFADANRRSVTLGNYVPADPNRPAAGTVTPITVSLVQALHQQRARAIPAEVSSLFAKPKPYTIGASDIISIIVYDHPELQPSTGTAFTQQFPDPTGVSSAPGFIVSADGRVNFPFIGPVKVEGMTEIEAAEFIRQRLARFIKEPQVTVRITAFRSRRAYVEGEVRIPGTQVFTDVPMTLLEAINRAGGITAAGDRSAVWLMRNNRTTAIDLLQMQELGINPNQILLESGDVVTVRSREESKIFVMGEISRPAALPMRNGRLTLNEALGEAGGPNLNTANTSQIYVIRNTGDGTPAVFHLNAGSPTALALAETFTLRPRDVVYIDPVPLVSWNRIVSLIIPSASTLNIGSQILTR
jgi:polysaccharide export outer membrane protein